MKRKLLIALGLALMLCVLFAVGAMAAADKLVISGYEPVTVGFASAQPTVTLQSSNATVTGVEFSITKKASKLCDLSPDTGVIWGAKAGKVTVTAKAYVNDKLIKGTKTVKIVKNEFTQSKRKAKDYGMTVGSGHMYFSTKRLYYNSDRSYLCAEMYCYNYNGGTRSPGAIGRWGGAISQFNNNSTSDTSGQAYISDAYYASKYIGCNSRSGIKNKGAFVVLIKFPVAQNPLLEGLNLRSGLYRVLLPGSANMKALAS